MYSRFFKRTIHGSRQSSSVSPKVYRPWTLSYSFRIKTITYPAYPILWQKNPNFTTFFFIWYHFVMWKLDAWSVVQMSNEYWKTVGTYWRTKVSLMLSTFNIAKLLNDIMKTDYIRIRIKQKSHGNTGIHNIIASLVEVLLDLSFLSDNFWPCKEENKTRLDVWKITDSFKWIWWVLSPNEWIDTTKYKFWHFIMVWPFCDMISIPIWCYLI